MTRLEPAKLHNLLFSSRVLWHNCYDKELEIKLINLMAWSALQGNGPVVGAERAVTLLWDRDQDVLLEVLGCSLCALNTQDQPVHGHVDIVATILQHLWQDVADPGCLVVLKTLDGNDNLIQCGFGVGGI